MKKLPLMTVLVLCLSTGSALFSTQALGQITAPYVLGCANPAPAAPGQPTVFFATCTTTAFVPTTSSSVIASVSKTAPAWSHSYSWYLTKDLTVPLVACPIGAIVTGSKCTNSAGADVSALINAPALPTFTLPGQVVPVTSNVTIRWTPPTANTDGSALSDLKSFNIYSGASVSTLKVLGTVPAGTLTFTTPAMSPGTYYFAATAVNTAGTESAQSAPVSATIAPPPIKKPGAPGNVTITVTVTAG